MSRPTCKAADLRPGVRVIYGRRWEGDPAVTVTILRERDPERVDLFGRPLQSWWARREDTGEEGFLDFGESLEALPLEVVT